MNLLLLNPNMIIHELKTIIIRVVDCNPGELVLAADIFKQRFQLYEK